MGLGPLEKMHLQQRGGERCDVTIVGLGNICVVAWIELKREREREFD